MSDDDIRDQPTAEDPGAVEPGEAPAVAADAQPDEVEVDAEVEQSFPASDPPARGGTT